jgi:thiamine transport system permease protein
LLPALGVGPALFVLTFYTLPLIRLLVRAVHPSDVSRVLTAPGLRQVVWFTLWQATLSTVLTVALGCAPAYVLARHRFRGRRMLLALVTVPFMLPTVVVGAAFLAVLPDRWHDTAGAVLAAHIFFNIAVVVRVVGNMWATIPTDLTAAARTLGATPRQVLHAVVWPLLRPAVFAAASVVFLFTFTSYGVVRVLGGVRRSTVEVEVARRATMLGDVRGAAVLSVLQLVFLAVIVWWSARWQRRSVVTMSPGRSMHTRTPRSQRLSLNTIRVVTVLAMGAPLAALIMNSFRVGHEWSVSAWTGLGHTEVRPGVSLGTQPFEAIATSLKYCMIAAALSVLLGLAASLAIGMSRRGGRLLDAGITMPLGTSAVTIGLGMLITFDRAPFDWRGQWWLVAVGHALIATPFVVRTLLPVLRSFPTAQRDAALMLAATPFRAWWHVEVRRLARPTLACAGFAAAISLGEFGASTFLTRSGHDTLPLAIAHLLARTGAVPQAQGFALATVLLVVCAVIVTMVEPRREDS